MRRPSVADLLRLGMPPEIRRVRPESRLDQLLAELRMSSHVEVIDLREALRQAKREARIYHKTDTHWNDAGALVAYREILARLRALFPDMNDAPQPGALKITTGHGGDLAQLMALEDRFPEERIEFAPAAPRRAREVPRDPIAESSSAEAVAMECRACGPRAIMFQDSFNATSRRRWPSISAGFSWWTAQGSIPRCWSGSGRTSLFRSSLSAS